MKGRIENTFYRANYEIQFLETCEFMKEKLPIFKRVKTTLRKSEKYALSSRWKDVKIWLDKGEEREKEALECNIPWTMKTVKMDLNLIMSGYDPMGIDSLCRTLLILDYGTGKLSFLQVLNRWDKQLKREELYGLVYSRYGEHPTVQDRALLKEFKAKGLLQRGYYGVLERLGISFYHPLKMVELT